MPSADIAIYLDRLRALPFVEEASAGAPKARTANGATLLLTAHGKHRTFDLTVLRTHLSRIEAERWIGNAKRPEQRRPLMLFAPYVSGAMGERLRTAGVQYVDQVGNIYLDLGGGRKGGAASMALVEGKRPSPVNRADAAWRAPSYQVLLALLAQPDLLAAPVRTIAAQAGVSTSPVLQVKKKLLQDGFTLQRRKERLWRPRGQRDARALWLHGYHTTLRPHLLVGHFRPRAALAVAGRPM